MGGGGGGVCECGGEGGGGWQELTFQPSGPSRGPKMSQATTVPAMDPTAPMMKAPKVLLAALRSLQHDHLVGQVGVMMAKVWGWGLVRVRVRWGQGS